ncbi:hypothetical protein RVM27_13965 [Halomonas sp. KM007]
MLTVNRRHSIHKQFQATRDRQICRAWRVERHDKTGRQHRSARWVLAITGLRKPTCTGRMIKKCSLAVIGKVSAPASRIQDYINDPTHVCFFSEATFRWWAAEQGLTVEFTGNDVVIFRKH